MIVRELLILVGMKLDRNTIERANRAIGRTTEKAGGLTKETGKLVRRVKLAAVGFLSLSAALGARQLVGTIVEFQRLRAVLVTFLGSEQAAEQAFQRLTQFAAETPFELQNVVRAFTQLRAVGIEPTIEELRAVGDVAAGSSRDITEFAQAAARAAFGEAEALKSFGIQAKFQGNQVKISFDDTTRTVKRDADEIFRALVEIGQANFAGGMERQAETLGGAFSNLLDVISIFMFEVGKAGLADALVDLVRLLEQNVGGGKSLAQAFGETLAVAVRALTETIRFLQENWRTLLGIAAAFLALRIAFTIGSWVLAFRKLTAATALAKAAVLALNIQTTLLGLKMLLVALMFVLLLAAVEDFIGFLQGKDAVIGDVLESFGFTGGPIQFIEKLGEARNALLLVLAGLALLLGVISGPFLIGFAAAAVIVGSLISIFLTLRDNWEFIVNLFRENAPFIVAALLLVLGPVGAIIGALLLLGAFWDDIVAGVEEGVDFLVGKLNELADAVPQLEGAVSFVTDLLGGEEELEPAPALAGMAGGGMLNPAVDAERRANEVRNNQRTTNVNATVQAPITVQAAPGADTDQIAAELERRMAGVMERSIGQAASDMEGAVD